MEILKHAGVALLGILGGVAVANSTSAGAVGPYSEDAVKAAYLYRFVGYVNWPMASPAAAPFTIAVFGAPGVSRELELLLPTHPIDGAIAQVRQITREQDLGSPQVLYVGAGHAGFLRTLKSELASKPILFVTDQPGGLDSGSVLNFLTVDRRVRFEISLTAAERLRLNISSELLSVAVRVRGGKSQSARAL